MPKTNPSRKDLLIFFGIIAISLNVIFYWKRKIISLLLILITFLLLILVALFPRLFIPIQKLWLKLGEKLGRINGIIIFSIIFLLIFVPISIFFKFTGRDFLNLKKKNAHTNLETKNTIGDFSDPF